MDDIVSRIQSIENRIQEIQRIGKPKNAKSVQQTNAVEPKQEKFSDILTEIMKTKAESDLNLLGDGMNTTGSSVDSLGSKLLENKLDSLITEYKKTGTMPNAEPKPIPSNIISSSNPGTWDDIISNASKIYDIDQKLIHAVIQAESAYNPEAVSHAGAEGLMQLMPYTAKDMNVQDSFDPAQNIMGGTKYLRKMLDYYKGDIVKTLAAYNAGPDAVDKNNGIPPYKETQEYVPRVLNYYYNLQHNNK